MARLAQAAQEDHERGQAQVGFGLAAAGGEKQQVDHLAVGVTRRHEPAQVHQDEGELEGPPRRRVHEFGCDARLLRAALPCGHGHRAVGQGERVERLLIIEQCEAVFDTCRRAGGVLEQTTCDLGAFRLTGQVA